MIRAIKGFRRISPILVLGAVTLCLISCLKKTIPSEVKPSIAVLLIDTDRKMGDIKEAVYGQFLEHINHSVVDGLFAEQVRGLGFEDKDFETYWKSFADKGEVKVVDIKFKNSEKSIKLQVNDGTAGIRQSRFYFQEGYEYNGYAWIKPLDGSVHLTLRVLGSDGKKIADLPIKTSGTDWQEVKFSFPNIKTDEQASLEITATGTGAIYMDYLSLMRADVRKNGMMRPDLVQSLKNLKPAFIRWPGGSFASIYKWKDGIGPQVSRKFHPNTIWGGYSDYYGFGTDEFMELCRQLDTDPMIVLSATNTDPEQFQDAMDWVHYLIDPSTTQWGAMRAANGHAEPYKIPYFQIDNEPMNHGLTPDQYAKIVNLYGSKLREIAPNSRIVACGQKRSNDMNWSEKIIDIAGKNFDILGVHNYEYEGENFQSGLMRIQDYLVKLRDYAKASENADIKFAVLEWGLCRTYDWRAGLHTAGSLIAYEKLSPELEMTCPALLLRNTEDDPLWTSFIYHDHVSWFPGSGYLVEKLFRDHFAEKHYSSTSGTFRDIENRSSFFDEISQMKPEDWTPGTVDAIATGSADGKRLVIKAVNYENKRNIVFARLQGSGIPENALVKVYTLEAALNDAPSMESADKIHVHEKAIPYTQELTIELEAYSVVVVEIMAN